MSIVSCGALLHSTGKGKFYTGLSETLCITFSMRILAIKSLATEGIRIERMSDISLKDFNLDKNVNKQE